MSSGGSGPLLPTFHGFVNNSMDGLVLFEACLSGKLHHVPRRPHDRERTALIKSGSIFIYEENASGIKRWTDGVAWSPSRILGNFLIYRELEKPFPPGEKKRAMKRKRASLPGEPYPRRDSNGNDQESLTTPLTPPSPNPASEVKSEAPSGDQEKDLERSLIGSLVDSYGFRPDGLVKKTMSISMNGVNHHMVSYYKVEDVKNNLLPRPMSDPRLANIAVRPELYLKQNFRTPVEENEPYAIDGNMHAHPQMSMYGAIPGYGVRPGPYMGAYPQMYGGANPYAPVSGASWPAQHVSAGPIPYGSHPGYSGSPYGNYYKQPSSATDSKQGDQHPPSHEMGYSNSYSPSYSSGVQQQQQPQQQRNGSQSTPNMIQTGYHAPVQQTSPNFTANRQSYNSNSMTSPTTNGQPQQQPQNFSPSAVQPYAVRSPVSQQNYGMQQPGGASNGNATSPHHGVKSPLSAGGNGSGGAQSATSASDPQLSYRSGSYSVGGAQQSGNPHSAGAGATGDMSGLGISTSNVSYGAANSSHQHQHHQQQHQAGGGGGGAGGGGGGGGTPQYGYATQSPASAGGAHHGHHASQHHSYRTDMNSPVAAQAAGQYGQ